MTDLKRLRHRLHRLRKKRRLGRLLCAASGFAAAFAWILAAAFFVDWVFELDRVQRTIALSLVFGAGVWAFRKMAFPWLGQRETLFDAALLVERAQGIDSDIVAALQFEPGESARWGSRRLEEAVISCVAELDHDRDLSRGVSLGPVRERLGVLGVTLGVLVLASAIFPGHARAFLDRLLLGTSHYPTRTSIERIAVAGVTLDPVAAAGSVVRSPYGRPVVFEAMVSGALPEAGRVVLSARKGGGTVEIPLLPAGGGPTVSREDMSGAATPVAYAGSLPRHTEDVLASFYLGDAWTDPVPIDLVPLPTVDLEFRWESPDYARDAVQGVEPASGSRQLSVVEGSRVFLRLVAAAKPLREAKAVVSGIEHALEPEGTDGRHWRLRPEGSPLDRVEDAVRYSIQVLDEDGLSLEAPIEGSIQIRPDRRPRVAAALVTQQVLPTGRPTISYGATDDYGIARIECKLQVQRREGKTDSSVVPIHALAAGSRAPTTLRDRHVLDLASLSLEKGDQVTVIIEATDFRGAGDGKSAASEPLVLQVTDERGVLAAMVDSDERSARQLDAIIERQLGIGDSK